MSHRPTASLTVALGGLDDPLKPQLASRSEERHENIQSALGLCLGLFDANSGFSGVFDRFSFAATGWAAGEKP
jgi:hypothetical protein